MIELDKENDLIKVDYAFIEDRIFAQLSQQEKDWILAHEVYYQMEKGKPQFILIDEASTIPGYGELILDPKYGYREPQREPREVKKKRKDFWNELPKPKRRRK